MPRPPASTFFWIFTLILTLGALRPHDVDAASIQYSTQGSVWPLGVGNGPSIDGTNVISFQPVTNGTLQAPGTFTLGTFTVATPPAGTSTTYHDAAFTVFLQTSTSGNVATTSSVTTYSAFEIDGVLNGTVTSSGQSNVTAAIQSITQEPLVKTPESSVNPIFDPPFPLPALSVTQPVVLASTVGRGQTPLLAQITTVPEPSALAVSAAALAGLAWLRRPLSGRRRGRPVVARSPVTSRVIASPVADPTLFTGDRGAQP